MAPEQSLLVELETAFTGGSSDRQGEILRRVTDLFIAGASQYSDEQSSLFDGVIVRLAATIETKARAELASRLASVANAPIETVQMLARDTAIEVAGPILSQSPRLTDDDLVAIAQEEGGGNNQARLLAISKRTTLSENVSYELVTRGDRDVLLSVSQNEGATLSDAGFGKLVDRTIDDEVLAISVGMRKDIPRRHFQTLISQASQVVFEKLAASNPDAVAEVKQVLTGITGQDVDSRTPGVISFGEAQARFEALRRAGKAADDIVQALAEGGRYMETVAALSALSGAPREFVESVLNDRRGGNDFTLLLAKAAGLAWPAAKQVCVLRRGPGGLPPLAIEAARRSYGHLRSETAQRVIGFYNERHTALDDFQLLAAKLHEQNASPR